MQGLQNFTLLLVVFCVGWIFHEDQDENHDQIQVSHEKTLGYRIIGILTMASEIIPI